MGPDGDADAVVDQYGRVYGIQGLRVADASIMPNIRRANTNLTCIMIGGEAQQAQAWARPGPADCIVRTRLDAGRASPDASV
jgi:GMC oxidoreductase